MKTIFGLGFCLFLLFGCGKRDPWDMVELDETSYILISIDTTRADHVGVNGYERETTPLIDKLASEGLIFTQGVTVSENTLISHASMLTGLYPGAHGATYAGNGTPILQSYTTLAEDFKAKGYHTAGFTAHGDWLNSRYGFDQGFDLFHSKGYPTADELLEQAGIWLDERRREAEALKSDSSNKGKVKPFFLFIHLFDVHSDTSDDRPYGAPAPFEGRFTQGYDGRLKSWSDQEYTGSNFLRAVNQKKVTLTPEDVSHLKDQYDEGLAYTDHALGEFLASLNREKLFIIITADHGEDFMEHGCMLHSSLFDPVARVPFIMIPPPKVLPLLGGPRKIHDQVSIVDIRATMAHLARLPKPEISQGVNLIPWLAGDVKRCPSNPAPFYYIALRHDGYKLFNANHGPALYDLKSDPHETKNLAITNKGEQVDKKIAEMQSFLEKLKVQNKAIRERHEKMSQEAPLSQDKEAERRLKELGY